MRILITGGLGFLGANLARALAESGGYSVIILDNLFNKDSTDRIKWVEASRAVVIKKKDIRDRRSVRELIKSAKPDFILHLAAQVDMISSINDPALDFEINCSGALNVLEAVRTHSPETRLIFSSTNKVYGDLEWVRFKENKTRFTAPDFPSGFDENTPLDFRSPYGCSKGSADQYTLDYCRLYGLRTAVFRHSSIYGPMQLSTFSHGWVDWFLRKALDIKYDRGQSLVKICGTGKQTRDILYVDDAVELYSRAIRNFSRIQGGAFNIGGGMSNSVSILELFGILEKEMGIKIKARKMAPRFADQKVFVSDTKKIEKASGWKARTDKIEGVRKTLEWIRAHGKY